MERNNPESFPTQWSVWKRCHKRGQLPRKCCISNNAIPLKSSPEAWLSPRRRKEATSTTRITLEEAITQRKRSSCCTLRQVQTWRNTVRLGSSGLKYSAIHNQPSSSLVIMEWNLTSRTKPKSLPTRIKPGQSNVARPIYRALEL